MYVFVTRLPFFILYSCRSHILFCLRGGDDHSDLLLQAGAHCVLLCPPVQGNCHCLLWSSPPCIRLLQYPSVPAVLSIVSNLYLRKLVCLYRVVCVAFSSSMCNPTILSCDGYNGIECTFPSPHLSLQVLTGESTVSTLLFVNG